MTNEELIAELRGHILSVPLTLLHDAAAALETADKRIEEQQKQIAQLYMLLNNRINEIEELLPKEGEWIDIDGTMFAECSVCGKRHYGCTTPYCDMCGAKMRTVTDCHTLEEDER
jgi:hypothetical protein